MNLRLIIRNYRELFSKIRTHIYDDFFNNSLMQDFSTWTREDFINFESRKSEVFLPTTEELESQRLEAEQNRKAIISGKLEKYSIVRPEVVTKDFCIQFLNSIDAKQYVGSDLELWIDNQISLF